MINNMNMKKKMWFNKKFKFRTYFFSLCFVLVLQEQIHQFHGVSFNECKSMCDDETSCLSARYVRRFYLCIIYNTLLDKGIKEPGSRLYIKSNTNSNTGCNDPDENALICQKRTCAVPKITGADMHGNLFDVGSKVQFTCQKTLKKETIECLSDGSWSANTLFCTETEFSACDYPGNILHGYIGTLVAVNDSHARLNVSCVEGYSLRSYGDILCEISTGTWSGFENSCCHQLHISNWTKIYSSPKGEFQLSILRWDKTEYLHECTSSIYQDTQIWDHWKDAGIKNINLTVIVENVAVAYMLFKANGTTNKSWFSGENLLQSSWVDLQPPLSIQEFSIWGIDSGFRRWFVAQHANYNDTCTEDKGWFVVTWNYYPCGETAGTGHRILYAKNGTSSTFIKGVIGEADRFEIWIEK